MLQKRNQSHTHRSFQTFAMMKVFHGFHMKISWLRLRNKCKCFIRNTIFSCCKICNCCLNGVAGEHPALVWAKSAHTAKRTCRKNRQVHDDFPGTKKPSHFWEGVVCTGLEPTVSLRFARSVKFAIGVLLRCRSHDLLLTTLPPRFIRHRRRFDSAPNRCERCALPPW